MAFHGESLQQPSPNQSRRSGNRDLHGINSFEYRRLTGPTEGTLPRRRPGTPDPPGLVSRRPPGARRRVRRPPPTGRNPAFQSGISRVRGGAALRRARLARPPRPTQNCRWAWGRPSHLPPAGIAPGLLPADRTPARPERSRFPGRNSGPGPQGPCLPATPGRASPRTRSAGPMAHRQAEPRRTTARTRTPREGPLAEFLYSLKAQLLTLE